MSALVQETAIVDPRASVGEGTRIWHHSQVREKARIGRECTIGKNVYIDVGVEIGERCKIQNGAQLFRGTVLKDGVFVGPGVIVTNDLVPRAIKPDGSLMTDADWRVDGCTVGRGASLGARAVLIAGSYVGEFAMVGAGAVVLDTAPSHALVVGVPARHVRWICACGQWLDDGDATSRLREGTVLTCRECGRRYQQLYRLPLHRGPLKFGLNPGPIDSGLMEIGPDDVDAEASAPETDA